MKKKQGGVVGFFHSSSERERERERIFTTPPAPQLTFRFYTMFFFSLTQCV